MKKFNISYMESREYQNMMVCTSGDYEQTICTDLTISYVVNLDILEDKKTA